MRAEAHQRLGGLVAVIAATLIAQAHADRIVFAAFRNLVTARMDPIISPGLISQHSHHILGGSNFKPTYDPDGLRKSECTSFEMSADKSQYWHPQVFRILENGSYIGMDTGTRVYYEFLDYDMEPFPYDFMMVGGDPARKSRTGTTADNAMEYYCEQVDSQGVRTGFQSFTLPTVPCDLLITKVFLPNCWNGKKYDPRHPGAHVAYPYDWFDGPNCPKGFERRLPSILIESFHFRANVPYHENSAQYILANGDTTGYGLHGDFVNGWEKGVLEGVMKNCPVGSMKVSEPADEACPYLAPFMTPDTWGSCRTQNEIPNESVGWYNMTAYPLDKLPGCNPPWTEGPKPTCPRPILAKTRGGKGRQPILQLGRGPGIAKSLGSLWYKPSSATWYP